PSGDRDPRHPPRRDHLGPPTTTHLRRDHTGQHRGQRRGQRAGHPHRDQSPPAERIGHPQNQRRQRRLIQATPRQVPPGRQEVQLVPVVPLPPTRRPPHRRGPPGPPQPPPPRPRRPRNGHGPRIHAPPSATAHPNRPRPPARQPGRRPTPGDSRPVLK